jgi:hypothetical protein
MEEVLGDLRSDLASPVCLAFKAHPEMPDGLFGTCDPGPHRYAAATRLIGEIFPDGHVFEDGIAWKRYVATGSISSILPVIRDCCVVLVANAGFADLGARWDLPRFHHLVIPPRRSHLDRFEILQRLSRELAEIAAVLPTGTAPLVLTQAGGSFSFWLLHRLRQVCPTGSFIDIGQALNPWFLDDPATGKPEMLWLQEYWKDIFAANGLAELYRRVMGIADPVAWFEQAHFSGEYEKRLPDFGGNHDFARKLIAFGKHEAALGFARRAVEDAPSSAVARTTLGQLLLQTGAHDEALRHVDVAIGMRPDLIMARLLRGQILFSQGDYRSFLAEMEALDIDEKRKPHGMIQTARQKLSV